MRVCCSKDGKRCSVAFSEFSNWAQINTNDPDFDYDAIFEEIIKAYERIKAE